MSAQPTELRRLHLELERCKQVCAATAEEWRSDAEEWKHRRDALLAALRWIDKRCPVALMDMPFHIHREMAHDAGACARAAIKAVEETK